MATTKQTQDERQQTLAHYVASGLSLAEAAENTGVSLSAAKVIQRSPLFEALVAKYQRETNSPVTERLVGNLEEFIEQTALPRLMAMVEDDKSSVSMAAIKATFELYKSLTTKDAKAAEASLTIVLSDRETQTLRELMSMPSPVVHTVQPVQSARQLLDAMQAIENV
jgi:transposase